MTALLKRLQAQGITLPTLSEQRSASSAVWTFSNLLQEKDADFFAPLVQEHALIQLEYNVQCAQLADELTYKPAQELVKQFETVLALAELLTTIYQDYLDVPREVRALQREQIIYRNWLKSLGYQFTSTVHHDELTNAPPAIYSPTRQLRDLVLDANWFRLGSLRLRRFFLTVLPFTNDTSLYRQVVNQADKVAAPVAAYIGWIFFIPRLFTNLLLLGKHLIPGPWMSAKEKALPWCRIRLKAQLDRRWFELANDAAWFTSGIINCFVLTGALGPMGLYVGVVMQAYDVLLASIRLGIEIHRLQKARAQYAEMLEQADSATVDSEQLTHYMKHLDKRITFEKKQLYIQVVNQTLILIAASCVIPALLFLPAIALLGGVLAVLTTIGCYLAVQKTNQSRPNSKVPALHEQGLFKPAPATTAIEPAPAPSSELIPT